MACASVPAMLRRDEMPADGWGAESKIEFGNMILPATKVTAVRATCTPLAAFAVLLPTPFDPCVVCCVACSVDLHDVDQGFP
jgi:hypothetical protein